MTTDSGAKTAALSKSLDDQISRIKLTQRLIALGWVPPHTDAAVNDDALATALAAYQEFFGIPVTGEADRFTDRSLRSMRFCGHPDILPIRDGVPRWPADGKPVTWFLTSEFPTMATADAKDAYQWSFDQWMAVCGIVVAYNPNPKTADILVKVQPIDQRAGILAQSQLPNGTRMQLEQFYDSAEPFVFSPAPKPHEIDVGRVMIHENGHMIGIGHLTAGNLLQSLYDPNLRSLQAGDIAEAVDRYGPPKPKAPQQTDAAFMVNVANIQIPGFRIVRDA